MISKNKKKNSLSFALTFQSHSQISSYCHSNRPTNPWKRISSHGEIVSSAVFRASLWFEESFQRRLAFTLLRMEESSRCVETLEQQMRDTNAGIDLKIFANRCCSYTTPLTNPQPTPPPLIDGGNKHFEPASNAWYSSILMKYELPYAHTIFSWMYRAICSRITGSFTP